MKTPLNWFAPFLVALAAVSPVQATQAPTRPSDDELRKIGTALAAYFDARDKESGVEAARAALVQNLAALRTKFSTWDPLRTSADLGRALELASQSRRADSRDGKVN